jgi:PilZ domain
MPMSKLPVRKETTMTQVLEGAQSEPANSMAANGWNASGDSTPNAMVYVYGHGPTRNPFYEEARALRAAPEGALLILSAAVNRGQKLLLISAAGGDPAEAQVIRTRTLDAQMFEVEIAFPFPRPDFWKPFPGSAKKNGAERRRSPRVRLPRGMTITWQGAQRRDVSRVSSLSLGGLFIETAEPAQVGDTLQVQFDIPGGAVRGQAVVRRCVTGQGMGVEFKELPEGSRTRLNELLQKLLGNVGNERS